MPLIAENSEGQAVTVDTSDDKFLEKAQASTDVVDLPSGDTVPTQRFSEERSWNPDISKSRIAKVKSDQGAVQQELAKEQAVVLPEGKRPLSKSFQGDPVSALIKGIGPEAQALQNQIAQQAAQVEPAVVPDVDPQTGVVPLVVPEDALGEYLAKSTGHKYIKKEGSGPNTKYTYADGHTTGGSSSAKPADKPAGSKLSKEESQSLAGEVLAKLDGVFGKITSGHSNLTSPDRDVEPQAAHDAVKHTVIMSKRMSPKDRKGVLAKVREHLGAARKHAKRVTQYEAKSQSFSHNESGYDRVLTVRNVRDLLDQARGMITAMKGQAVKKAVKKSLEVKMSGIDQLGNLLEKSSGGPFTGPRGGKWADSAHTIPWSEKRAGAGKAQKKNQNKSDAETVRELTLFIVNDGGLHNMHMSGVKNLVNKMASGKYDHAQAAKLFNYLTTEGAKRYTKEHGTSGSQIFTPADRMAAAKQIADDFHTEAELGNYDDYLNKKNKKAVGTLDTSKKKEDSGSGSGKMSSGERGAMEGFLNNVDEVAFNFKKISAMSDDQLRAESEKHYDKPKASGGHSKADLANVWQNTHKDYKGTTNGKRGILVDRDKGTTIVPLEDLTADEVKKRVKVKKSLDLADWLQAETIDDQTMADNLEKAYNGEFDEEFEKSTLPTGEPTMGGAGEEQGGKVANVGKTSGSNNSDAGPAIGAPTAKKQKLSEDDDEETKQMKPGKKFIEGRKSLAPADQRDSVAYERAQFVSGLRKGEADIVAGVGVVPETKPTEQPKLVKSWGNTPGSQVVYTDGSDQAAADLVKSEEFYPHGAPSLGNPNIVLTQVKQCPACKNSLSKSLAVCPTCGYGAQVAQVAVRSEPMNKSLGQGFRPRVEQDLYLPNGTTKED